MAKILAPDSLKNKNTLFSFALYLFSETISKKISTFKENWKLERSRVPHCTSLAGICISPIDRFAPIGSRYSIAELEYWVLYVYSTSELSQKQLIWSRANIACTSNGVCEKQLYLQLCTIRRIFFPSQCAPYKKMTCLRPIISLINRLSLALS